MTGGKPIAVLLQSISGVNAINPLVAFYDILGRERSAKEVKERGAILLFCPGHHTRLYTSYTNKFWFVDNKFLDICTPTLIIYIHFGPLRVGRDHFLSLAPILI
jgi:hypothetical protein